MINKELAEKYHLPPKEEYPFGEHDWYATFLIQSDKDTLSALEEIVIGGKKGGDYAELLAARQEARQMLDKIEQGGEK